MAAVSDLCRRVHMLHDWCVVRHTLERDIGIHDAFSLYGFHQPLHKQSSMSVCLALVCLLCLFACFACVACFARVLALLVLLVLLALFVCFACFDCFALLAYVFLDDCGLCSGWSWHVFAMLMLVRAACTHTYNPLQRYARKQKYEAIYYSTRLCGLACRARAIAQL